MDFQSDFVGPAGLLVSLLLRFEFEDEGWTWRYFVFSYSCTQLSRVCTSICGGVARTVVARGCCALAGSGVVLVGATPTTWRGSDMMCDAAWRDVTSRGHGVA